MLFPQLDYKVGTVLAMAAKGGWGGCTVQSHPAKDTAGAEV